MRILVIGSGGREHAIVRALSADPGSNADSLHAAPGNPGIAALAETHPGIDPAPDQIVRLARKLSPDLVVVGPEAPLVAGAADALREAGVSCFGPDADAAMIEGSKSFAKQVMTEAGIPTAASFTCATGAEADRALAAFGPPYVVKDDALAAGKGVVVTADLEAARAHARACGTVVIEEFLDGPEVSLFAVCDGVTAVPLLPAQDFKRARDGDQGPNTGGMGAYAPLPWAPSDLAEHAMARVIQPAVDTMRRRGTPYRGLLYAGLCLTPAGLRVVEFNARFGDPETQVVLDRLGYPAGPAAARRRHRRPGWRGTAAVAARRRGRRGDRRRGLPGAPGQGRPDQDLWYRTVRGATPGRPRRAAWPGVPAARGHRRRGGRAARARRGRGGRPGVGRRPGAERGRLGPGYRGRPGRGLPPRGHDRTAWRLVPPRHRRPPVTCLSGGMGPPGRGGSGGSSPRASTTVEA